MANNLSTNENFYTISEPFNPSKNRIVTYSEIIEKMSTSDTVVTKNHILDVVNFKNTNEELYSLFNEIDFSHVCLLRRNVFDCTLSRCIAKIKNQWDEYTYSVNDSIVVPEYFFKSELLETFRMWSLISTNMLNIEYQTILYYEDLSFDSKTDCKLIGSIYNGVEVTYSKSPDKNSIVKNVDELKRMAIGEINTVSVSNVTVDGFEFSLDFKL